MRGVRMKRKVLIAGLSLAIVLIVCAGVLYYFLSGNGSSKFISKKNKFDLNFIPVEIGHKWGYIDKTGKIVINPQFKSEGYFKEGFAPVEIGNKWGYIDKTGKIVINPQFNSIKWLGSILK